MAKAKTTTILLALTAALWAVPSANALEASHAFGATASLQSQHASLDCPACRKPMIWKWVKINGVWVKRWFCPEPTCN